MFAPNSLIENLLQSKKSQAALTLDALFATDTIKLPSLDVATVLHYFKLSGVAIGESIVRRGLFDLARIGLLATRKIITRGKGRPAWEYRAGSVQAMAKVLGVELHQNEASDSIPESGFKSVKAYRAAKHYSFLARLKISQLSRKKLGARLGVSGRSTYNYELGQKLQVIQRTETTKLSKADIESAPSKKTGGNAYLVVEWERELNEEELAEKYKDFDPAYKIFWRAKKTESQKMPYTRFILERELGKGRTVWLVQQITNEYRVGL